MFFEPGSNLVKVFFAYQQRLLIRILTLFYHKLVVGYLVDSISTVVVQVVVSVNADPCSIVTSTIFQDEPAC